MADGFTPVFSPAGAGHRAGAVPDPGVDTPDDYVLRADATWGPQGSANYQFGLTGATIAAGDPDVVVTIDFVDAYLSPPVMVVSSGGEQVMASFSNVTLDSFRLHLTAATPVIADTPVTGSWLALG
jgi:hypothetical protein